MENTKYLIWLNMIFSNSYQTIWKIIKRHLTLYEAYCTVLARKVKLTAGQSEKINTIPLEKAEDVIKYCSENGIGIVCYDSDGYPEQLRNLEYPPLVLYYRGDLSCISSGRNITCVGTRTPSEYTVRIITEVCTELSANGFTIVSGFADGADITAHLSAVNQNRPTVCVLGCGVDYNYPRPNFRYRDEVIKNGGVILSEYAPTEGALTFHFPKRNVILACLSDATLVFEASDKSGSLITAGEAVKQNKKLLCVPPADISDTDYAGNIKLLREGAEALYGTEEVYRIYGVKKHVSVMKKDSAMEVPEVKKQKRTSKKKVPEKAMPETPAVQERVPEKPAVSEALNEQPLSPVKRQILDMLRGCTLHMDIITYKLGIEMSDVTLAVSELQIAGLIEEVAGNRFRLR